MDRLYECSESASGEIPKSLELVLSNLTDNQDGSQLFLALVYVLTLESGFEPVSINSKDSGIAELSHAALFQKTALLGQQMIFKYNSQTVLHWSHHWTPSTSSPSGHLHKWRFSTGGLGNLLLSVEFVQSSKNSLLALISGVIEGSRLSVGCCFDVNKFVPNPMALLTNGKFDKITLLSQELKTELWLARIEILYVHGIVDKSAFEFLPQHVLELIAKYLPERASRGSTDHQFVPYIIRPSRGK